MSVAMAGFCLVSMYERSILWADKSWSWSVKRVRFCETLTYHVFCQALMTLYIILTNYYSTELELQKCIL